MRDIAALVFGSEPAEPRAPREHAAPREHGAAREPFAPRDEHLCDGPPAPSGDWCQTTPGHATLGWFALTLGARARKHR
jgi:hypothetical protein